MIVSRHGSGLVLVTQPDHAALAGALMALWRADGMPDHPRRDDLVFAAREHDNGWQEIDAAPLFDPASGRPTSFDQVPEATRRELWARGVRRYATERPYAMRLICHHARDIYQRHREDPAWSEFFADLETFEAELPDPARAPEAVAADALLLRTVDSLSLAACGHRGGSGGRLRVVGGAGGDHQDDRGDRKRGELAARIQDDAVWLDPFPLAGSTTLEVACRLLPKRHYASARSFREALLEAPWIRRAIRWRRLVSPSALPAEPPDRPPMP